MEAKEITTIIRACKSAGVESIKFGDVEISFLSRDLAVDQEIIQEGGFIDESTFPMYQGKADQKEVKESAYAASEQVRQELLLLEDPLAWEEQELRELESKEV